ncbi:outer membrane protein assembly factor BamB [Thiomicrorhabdus aquaedulcis]|uniref:outer membrane protein assembly factor BamB n=1 Tax=Thiomicrorhabdus aquaedulcis TaxID=2211106 RepID=UPI000FDC473E|nr:outer membrane protein assembly factor BamB [Thiomicrorhabdus aquaedulcis]
MTVRFITVLLATVLLTACSSPKIVKQETVLSPLESALTLDRNWQVKLKGLPNKDAEGLFFSQDDERVFIALTTGHLTAFKKDNTSRWTDQVIWTTQFSEGILSGPTRVDDRLIVGTDKGNVMALSADDGHIIWQTELSSEVLSLPVIAERKIFTRTVDGRLYALDLASGKIIWTFEHQIPSLSLRGAPAVVYEDGKLFVGWESGMVQAFTAKSGDLLWEARVAVPKGRTDLERVVDVQSSLVFTQGRLFVMGFHGKLASINPENGNFYFIKELSGYRDFVADDSALYVVDDEDVIQAFDLGSGVSLWKQAALKNRTVGDLVFFNDLLLATDDWGYVHFINKVQGTEYARVKHSNEYGDGNYILRVFVQDNRLYLLDEEGVITSYQVRPSTLAQFKAELAQQEQASKEHASQNKTAIEAGLNTQGKTVNE